MFIAPARPTHASSQLDIVAFINERVSAKRSTDLDRIEWFLDLSGMTIWQELFQGARNQIDPLVAKGWTIVANDTSESSDPAAKSIKFLADDTGWRYIILLPPAPAAL